MSIDKLGVFLVTQRQIDFVPPTAIEYPCYFSSHGDRVDLRQSFVMLVVCSICKLDPAMIQNRNLGFSFAFRHAL